ncbi:efflux RND transporter periplasmic adaptor subunit [Palleronia sp.]|uniref:efflux RND transporter periplasmic adaptor subunit n=1 Tax=Palleronia sp. TaxID=1940284 RepID=UPI0035C7E3F6
MNAMSHSPEILDRLKSLSIDREEVAPAKREDRAARRPLPGRSLVVLVLLCSSAAWLYQSSATPVTVWQDGRETLKAYLGAASNSTEADVAVAEVPASDPSVAAPVIAPAPTPAIIGSGYVVADRELPLMPDIGGRLDTVSVDIGDTFEAGQIIATLDRTAARADLHIARAGLAMAEASHASQRASLDEARALAETEATLLASGWTTKASSEAAHFSLLRLEREVEVGALKIAIARREVEKSEDTLARHTIRAPFAGIVVARHLNPGDIAVSGLGGDSGTAIATLIDPDALSIEVDVAETSLSAVAPGQTARVELDAYPGRKFDAEITTIAPIVSVQKGTALVRLTLDHPPIGVFANMSAKVTFDAIERTASLRTKGD